MPKNNRIILYYCLVIKSIIVLTFFTLFSFWHPVPVGAISSSYITIVNPVRGSDLSGDAENLSKQAEITASFALPVTWLLQYDVLSEQKYLEELNKYKANNEIGIFLEVSEKLATDSQVPYLMGKGDWARPDKVFLSGYTPNERKRMTDKLMESFRLKLGKYPKSVGVWYIDAYSQDYLVNKYGITAILDCTDQYTTDKYQIWGKPWGVPFDPSVFNPLVPSQNSSDKLDTVKIQWAERDPLLAYGATVSASTFSLQANDYVGHHGFDTEYFKRILNSYIQTDNPVSQATVGLEVGGLEGKYLGEYENQLSEISKLARENKVKVTTMSDFAEKFKKLSPSNVPTLIKSEDNKAFWYNSPYYRAGFVEIGGKLFLRDLRVYKSDYLESDLVDLDTRTFLYRIIPAQIDDLVYKNAKLIATNVYSISLNRKEGGRWIGEIRTGNKKEQLIMGEKELKIGNNNLLSFSSEKSNFRHKLSKFLFLLSTIEFPQIPFPRLVWSTIDNRKIIGLENGTRVLGLKTRPLQIGAFDFPFQTLVRFKSLPFPNLYRILFRSDSQAEFEDFTKSYNGEDLLIFKREETDIHMINKLEESGKIRIFENSLYQVWK